jgi:hypothetical protein
MHVFISERSRLYCIRYGTLHKVSSRFSYHLKKFQHFQYFGRSVGWLVGWLVAWLVHDNCVTSYILLYSQPIYKRALISHGPWTMDNYTRFFRRARIPY